MNIAVIVLVAAIILVALVCCIVAVRRRRVVAAAVVGMLVLVVVAIAVLVTMKPRNGPALNGGLTLEAAPGVGFYVGEKLVGTGKVFLPWHALVESDGKQRPAIKWEPEDSFDVFKQNHHAAIAEGVGGRGAVFLLRDNEFKSGFGNDFEVMGEQILLRRADGMLDRVLVLYAKLRTVDGQRAPFLVPIRVRQDRDYLVTKPEDGYGGLRGHYLDPPLVRAKLHLSGTFVIGSPPKEFAEEINEKGLWEPANR